MSALLSGGEVIQVHLGASGANIAAAFWQQIAKEHHLVTSLHLEKTRQSEGQNESENSALHAFGPYIKQNPNEHPEATTDLTSQILAVFFHETLQRHVPRAVFVDSDPAAKYNGLFEPASPLKHFFRPENFIFGRGGSSGVRSKAISEGLVTVRSTINAITREMELADSVQAIQITEHLGGGTGAGLGCLLLEYMRDEIGTKTILFPTTLLPTPRDIGRRTTAVEVYNSILSLPEVAENCDIALLADNEALYDICFRLVGLNEPGWRDLNHILAAIMAGFSSCMRFPSVHSKGPNICKLTLRDMASTLGLPNLPFTVGGFAPLTNRGANAPLGGLLLSSSAMREQRSPHSKFPPLKYRRAGTRMPSVSELCRSLFKPSHLLASVDPLGHYYSSALAVFRGQLSPDEIDQELNFARLANPDRYREWSQWIPSSITARICPEADVGLNLSVSWVGSTTAIGATIDALTEQFDKLISKRAYVHIYVSEGLEEAEFSEKRDLCKDIVELYEAHFGQSQALRVEEYEAKRDLGLIPFNWKLSQTPMMVFDTQKSIELQWS